MLFWTLDQLVARYGHTGIFFVNDLYDEYAEVAADRLRVYAESKGYLSVAIKTLSGDYEKLDFKDVLSPIGIDRFTTIHLKNPEISLFHDAMDGDALSSTHETRAKSRALLAHLAAWSESGLYLFILDHDDFLPEAEREEFIHHGIFYHPTTDWEAVPYIYPEGKLFSSPGAVFHIKDPDCHLRFTAS